MPRLIDGDAYVARLETALTLKTGWGRNELRRLLHETLESMPECIATTPAPGTPPWDEDPRAREIEEEVAAELRLRAAESRLSDLETRLIGLDQRVLDLLQEVRRGG